MQIELPAALEAELLRIAEDDDWVEFRQLGERPSGQLERIADEFRKVLRGAEWEARLQMDEMDDELEAAISCGKYWEHEIRNEPDEYYEWEDDLEADEPTRSLPSAEPAGTVLEDGFVLPF